MSFESILVSDAWPQTNLPKPIINVVCCDSIYTLQYTMTDKNTIQIDTLSPANVTTEGHKVPQKDRKTS